MQICSTLERTQVMNLDEDVHESIRLFHSFECDIRHERCERIFLPVQAIQCKNEFQALECDAVSEAFFSIFCDNGSPTATFGTITHVHNKFICFEEKLMIRDDNPGSF